MLGPGGAVGIKVLELYAGTGSVGMDLLARGATRVDFVEIDRSRANKIRNEVATMGLASKTSIYQADAIKALPRLAGTSYDVVFADPPYEIAPWAEIVDGLRRNDLLAPDAWIIAEHGSRNPLPDTIFGAEAINRKRYGDTSITIYAFPNRKETEQRS
jgi:16S rRNA (guanine966-N2)-methyltransferase